MKVVKGFRLYYRSYLGEILRHTEHPDLEDLNRELKKMGYELTIGGFFKPYKFHNFRHNRTYKFATLFESVADEFFVSYSYVLVDATEEEIERLSGKVVQIKKSNALEEYNAAILLHGPNWHNVQPYHELYYQGKLYLLDRKTGVEKEIKKVIDFTIDLPEYIYDCEKVEYID